MERRLDDEVQLERLKDCLAAVADIQRLRLLRLLVDGRLNVTELVDLSGLRQPLVSHHLAVLSRGGLVEIERSGKFRFYRLAPRDAAAAAVLALLAASRDRDSDRAPAEEGFLSDRAPIQASRASAMLIEDYLL